MENWQYLLILFALLLSAWLLGKLYRYTYQPPASQSQTTPTLYDEMTEFISGLKEIDDLAPLH